MTEFPVLGHIISDNGSIVPCYRSARKSIWKAYFGNIATPSFRRAPDALKLRLLDRACRPALAFRCSRWPPQKTQTVAVDRLQTKLIAAFLRIQRLPGEDVADYVRRRNRSAARVAGRSGRWSLFWAQRITRWDEHIRRAHDPKQWCSKLV